MHLDLLDRKILQALDINSRATITEISKSLRLGSDLVDYRIKKYFNDKVINRCSAQIDYAKLGLTVYKSYLKVSFQKKRIEELIKYLNGHKKLYWLSEWYGNWDILFSLFCSSNEEFIIERDKIFKKFSEIIINFESVNTLDVERYSKNYLINSKKQFIKYGRSNKLSTNLFLPDKLDAKILFELNNNARVSYVEIAQKLNESSAVIKYRVERLQDSKVIVGYLMQLNNSKLNLFLFKILFKSKSFDGRFESNLREFCRNSPNVTCYIKQFGNYQYELEAEFFSYDQYHLFIDEFREKFDKQVYAMEHLVLRKDYLHRMLNFNI